MSLSRITIRSTCCTVLCLTVCCLPNPAFAEEKESPKHTGILGSLETQLAMAGSASTVEYHPLSQSQRNDLYLKGLINPLGITEVLFSAGLDHLQNKPGEWEQGLSGYSQRVANIEGQNLCQQTVTFGLSSWLHEDNRYFSSGKQGIWSRSTYAVTASVLARHDNGRYYVSVSQLSGVAAGAFIARAWLPPSESRFRDGAASFGLTLAGNAATSILKEFLPDITHRIFHKKD